jgi:hypothetical protein
VDPRTLLARRRREALQIVPGSATCCLRSTFFDPFDNGSQCAWRTSDGRIESITDARGMQIFFDWSGDSCTVKLRNTSKSSDFSGRSWSFMLSSGKVVSIPQTPQAVVASGGSAAIGRQ